MIQTCKAAMSQFQGVLDLACPMLVKIMKMVLVCLETFPEVIEVNSLWKRILEGIKGPLLELATGI